MEYLKLLNKKFYALNFKTKLQLYLLPLLLLYFFFYFYEIKVPKKTIETIDFKSKKMKNSYIQIIKQIEEFALSNNISIKEIKHEKKKLFITSNISFEDIESFLFFIENINSFSSLQNIKIYKNNKLYSLDFTIDFSKYYIKNLDTNIYKSKKSIYVLNAIANKHVFINEKWYFLGDKIGDYKVNKITKTSVELSNDKDVITLKVFKNESK